MLQILANIKGIEYTPYLCSKLDFYEIAEFQDAMVNSTFGLNIDKENSIVVSKWVSPKRTRSYPYARVYNSLNFSGRKITIIPLIKDEGKRGDRDYLAWDTISLMSLLGVYVIIAYYNKAGKSSRYDNKITNQQYDIKYIQKELQQLLKYQSDALHWNIAQIDKIGEIGKRTLEAYKKISDLTNVEMHSFDKALKRIEKISNDKDTFKSFSRELAHSAQERESHTLQPKEKVSGDKATITIKNYLGGLYYLTCDEACINNNSVELIECKHSKDGVLPSIDDIKDGLVKMILFSNLENVSVDSKKYNPIPILKLTGGKEFKIDLLKKRQLEILLKLQKEAINNNFKVIINNMDLRDISLLTNQQ